MAKIIPSDWDLDTPTGAKARQIETLARFQHGLPARYTVLHGASWLETEAAGSLFGGVDFVVVAPSGRVLLIQQKAGFLAETPDGLIKTYATHRENVALVLSRARRSLAARLEKAFGADSVRVDGLFYCPDYLVRDAAVAGLAASHIVDSRRRDQLVAIVLALLPEDEAPSRAASRVSRFLCDLLELVPDTHAIRAEASARVIRLSQGLALWARALTLNPHRLRVIGTAGSGKTQLALSLLADAARLGRRALYVCFNRPLADHMQTIAPAEARVCTYHQLCEESLRALGQNAGLAGPDAFARLERAFAEQAQPGLAPFDVLIVDEGQDFADAWVAPLLRLARPATAIWWLEDPLQSLYPRERALLDDFAELRVPTNYRSPRDIVAMLDSLFGGEAEFQALGPLLHAELELRTYATEDGLRDETMHAVTAALQAGYSRADIVIVSYHGREHSHLLGLDSLGPYPLRRFVGEFDLLGNPIYRDGDVLIESLFRYKGQSSACIIFTEIDFETLDDAARRRLFVGATRARMRLTLVAAPAASEALVPHLAAT